MAPVPDGASDLPRSKPKTASPKRFAWRLYPFTTTSPTWATITVLNAPATVPSKPPRTPLINSPASFIISLKLGSLMMKLFLQSLKLVTKNTVCTSYKLSLGKWVTHSCRPMRDPQFLERGGCAEQSEGADGVVRTAKRFGRTDHPGAAQPPLLCEEGNLYFPRCLRSLSFSLQTYSSMSLSGISLNGSLRVKGRV